MLRIFLCCLAFLSLAGPGLLAQAPSITGNFLLCPNACETFRVDSATSYRWFTRAFGSNDTLLLDGATDSTVSICYGDTPLYLSAEIVREGTTLRAPEVLVDGLVFLPPAVESTGDFTIGDEGQSLLCPGDTLRFRLLDQTAVNVRWFRDGSPLEGEDGVELIVTKPGSYTVVSAPGECPDFVQNLGLTLEVETCSTNAVPEPGVERWPAPYPNPTSGTLFWDLPTNLLGAPASVYDGLGRRLWSGPAAHLPRDFSLTSFPRGSYYVRVQGQVFRVIKG